MECWSEGKVKHCPSGSRSSMIPVFHHSSGPLLGCGQNRDALIAHPVLYPPIAPAGTNSRRVTFRTQRNTDGAGLSKRGTRAVVCPTVVSPHGSHFRWTTKNSRQAPAPQHCRVPPSPRQRLTAGVRSDWQSRGPVAICASTSRAAAPARWRTWTSNRYAGQPCS